MLVVGTWPSARIGAAGVVAVLTVFTIVGQTGTAATPAPAVLAVQSLVFIAAVTGVGWWLDRRPTDAS